MANSRDLNNFKDWAPKVTFSTSFSNGRSMFFPQIDGRPIQVKTENMFDMFGISGAPSAFDPKKPVFFKLQEVFGDAQRMETLNFKINLGARTADQEDVMHDMYSFAEIMKDRVIAFSDNKLTEDMWMNPIRTREDVKSGRSYQHLPVRLVFDSSQNAKFKIFDTSRKEIPVQEYEGKSSVKICFSFHISAKHINGVKEKAMSEFGMTITMKQMMAEPFESDRDQDCVFGDEEGRSNPASRKRPRSEEGESVSSPQMLEGGTQEREEEDDEGGKRRRRDVDELEEPSMTQQGEPDSQ